MKIVKIFSLVLLLVLSINSRPVAAHHFSDFEQCRKEVIEVVPGVYVAVNYGFANSILIEGDDGVIIVDTTEGTEAAQQVLAQFRKITKKPVKAIIYTHSHPDHTGGAKVFAGDGKIDIYARANFPSEGLKLTELKRIYKTRTYWEHGFYLSLEEHVNAGKGACDHNVNFDQFETGFLPPNHTFDQDRIALEIAGVKLELVAAPGETDDQLYVWLPDKKVLLCGDNYRDVFPNIYAIKGSYRDIFQWADSLDAMLREHPKYLIPGHEMPVIGAENVKQVLSDYRDGMRSVIEQTLAGMDRGLTPDRLVEVVKLPPELANKPYLQESYGTVPWTVRAIYTNYLGWFDGNATNLFPLSPVPEAQRIAQLTGGKEELLQAARDALEAQDYQWTSQLADYLIVLQFHTLEAKLIKAEALTSLAQKQSNVLAEHYYLSAAKQLRQQVDSKMLGEEGVSY